ncbi:DMT family transporter [Candidatus Magnetomonas plexicatena]|uniref:DMT family transporter n=1 Tax=Candidatus Magnetomonas plexicatena TaxID=2552947 RepID=UPI001104DBC6|nr:EamA family transporter [Nitrospirales bacterium LBB_01]
MVYYLYIILAMIIWSSLGVFIKSAELPVATIMFYPSAISVFLQLPMFLNKKMRQNFPSIKKIPLLGLISLIVLTNTYSFFLSYSWTTISNAVFTHYIAPVLVAVLSPIFLKDKLHVSIFISLTVATIGLWLIFRDVSIVTIVTSGGFDRNFFGIISGLISGVMYAVLVIMLKLYMGGYNRYIMVFLQNTFVSLYLLPFVTLPSRRYIWMFIVIGVFHSTIANYLYYKGLEKVQACRAAILGYIEPVGAILFGIIFLSEHVNLLSLIGGVLIILSGYIVMRQKNEECTQPL